MKFSQIVFEAKDVKSFQKAIKELVLKDNKAKSLLQAFRKDDDKMVDYIDYIMGKHTKDLDKLMKEFNINYDEAIDIIAKGI